MVQGSSADDHRAGTLYVACNCPACGRVHLVNPKTGKLMSEEHAPGSSTGTKCG